MFIRTLLEQARTTDLLIDRAAAAPAPESQTAHARDNHIQLDVT
jgi:hypothetical protein